MTTASETPATEKYQPGDLVRAKHAFRALGCQRIDTGTVLEVVHAHQDGLRVKIVASSTTYGGIWGSALFSLVVRNGRPVAGTPLSDVRDYVLRGDVIELPNGDEVTFLSWGTGGNIHFRRPQQNNPWSNLPARKVDKVRWLRRLLPDYQIGKFIPFRAGQKIEGWPPTSESHALDAAHYGHLGRRAFLASGDPEYLNGVTDDRRFWPILPDDDAFCFTTDETAPLDAPISITVAGPNPESRNAVAASIEAFLASKGVRTTSFNENRLADYDLDGFVVSIDLDRGGALIDLNWQPYPNVRVNPSSWPTPSPHGGMSAACAAETIIGWTPAAASADSPRRHQDVLADKIRAATDVLNVACQDAREAGLEVNIGIASIFADQSVTVTIKEAI